MNHPMEERMARKLQRAKVFLAAAIETQAIVDSALTDDPGSDDWKERKKKIDRKVDVGREALWEVFDELLEVEPGHKVEVVKFPGNK